MDLSTPNNFGPDTSRVVAIVVFDGARALDVAGAMEVFSGANAELQNLGRYCDRSAYVVQVLFVPGVTGESSAHWPRLADLIANVAGQADRVVVPDGGTYADLSLALIRDDHGDEIATRVAARASQNARPHPALPPSADPRIEPLVAWIVQDPRREFSAELLASQAAMSVRTLSRLFVREMGITPSKFVEKVRVGIARNLLNNSRLGLATIAAQSGFGSEERMRRAFRRAYGTSPRAYIGSA
jgi:transcriptional regulator GlxA family with amidase domain